MIINHQYKYIFIAIPYSASSTISRELIDIYHGQTILHKHANIPIVKNRLKINLKQYFKFGVIRDPIDISFSIFNKYITNANNVFTDSKYFIENGGHITKRARRIFNLINDQKLGFENYIKLVNKVPYDNLLSLNYPYLDYLIRYDNLDEDFEFCLNSIGLKPARELPYRNITKKKDLSANINEQLKNFVFGPFYYKYRKHLITKQNPVIFANLIYHLVQPYRFYRWNKLDTIKINNSVREYDSYYFDNKKS